MLTKLAATLCSLAMTTSASFAEVSDQASSTPASNGDLAIIEAKAAADRSLQTTFEMLRQFGQSGADDPMLKHLDMEMRDVIIRMTPFRGGELPLPLNIAAWSSVHDAEDRAQILSQMLIADLDGNWEITSEELKAALEIRSIPFVPEAFFAHDADSNLVLSAQEIRQAIRDRVNKRNNRSSQEFRALLLFDFDDDGLLTEAELDRAVAAFMR